MAKKTRVLFLALVLTCVGCAGLDSFFGVDKDTGTVDPNNPSSTVGAMATPFVPIAGSIVGLAGWLYSTVRSRKYKSAALSVIDGIQHVVENADSKDKLAHLNPEAVAELLAVLKERQIKDGTRGTINGLIK